MKTIETAGYPPNAIEVEAFQLALPALAPIERLIVSAQKCLDRYLEDLERTSKAHARALAAEKAIAENAATGVAKVSGMAQIAANQRNAQRAAVPAVKRASASGIERASPRAGRRVDQYHHRHP